MTSRIVIAGFAVTLVAAGCATMHRDQTSNAPCNHPGVCKIDVPLDGCKVSPPLADIDVFGPQRVIQWELQGSPNITFAQPDGIFLKDDSHQQFGPGQRPASRKFIMPDKNSVVGTYHYGIKLMDGNTPCPVIDPGIINHG